MTRRSHIVSREDGLALPLVVILTSVLALLSVIVIELVRAESGRSVQVTEKNASFQAAEAGLDDYLAKLVDDKTFYFRNVHPAESTRRPTSGPDVDPGTSCTAPKTATGVVWTASITWTYPNGKDNWCDLSNGYQYNLQITPPSASNLNIRIVATGRKIGSTNTADWRAIEEWVRFDLVSDFQMITTNDYVVGSTATTNGKIYAGRDIRHSGTATADVFAERFVNPSCCATYNLVAPAQQYDQTTIRTILPNPIDFNTFTGALDDIKRAAQASGNYTDDTVAARKIVLQANGTYTLQSCTATCTTPGNNPQPTWGAATTYNVPTNGAIYSEKPVVVSGVVDGRVTIASNEDVIVGADISYENAGDDVLGLIGKDEIIIAKYAPATLNWRAAVIAQNGARHSWDSTGSHTLANHTGSTASKGQPYMDMFFTRNYFYDPPLQYLPPPWFPVLDEAYTVNLFREVQP